MRRIAISQHVEEERKNLQKVTELLATNSEVGSEVASISSEPEFSIPTRNRFEILDSLTIDNGIPKSAS